jgi:hypothetical protein
MAIRQLPDAELLRKLLRYEPETGEFYWRQRPIEMFSDHATVPWRTALLECNWWNSRFAGKRALNDSTRKGYLQGRIRDGFYAAHRIAWAITYGEDPIIQIDHINGDKADNRISNLRLATPCENAQNRPRNVTNRSGYKGVHWSSLHGMWRARIRANGTMTCLGFFDDPESAHAAYCEAAQKYHGQFWSAG